MGHTGSGKTTLTRLLLRLYDPITGHIFVDNTDIRQFQLTALRQYIGIVTQDVQLFHASIRDNLTFFDTNIPDTQIEQSLQELGLWPWYSQLPNGLDTLLESGGGSLSAGQAQLLALTRIFLKNPSIILMDEASSRLDPITEQLLEQALDKLLINRTAIIIAHRLTTLARTDTILLLENGSVREFGSRQKLSNDPNSYFAQLLRSEQKEVQL